MPARNTRRRTRQTVKRKPLPRKIKLVLFGVGLVFVLGFFCLWILSSSAIDREKFSVVQSTDSGDALVVVYDFGAGEITTVKVPAETYLGAAYEYGEWRVGSLQKLGEQEGYGGELLRLSLVKSLHFPIDAWQKGGDVLIGSSSLNIREKMQLKWFEVKTSKQNWYEVDLVKMGYLKKSTVPDGEEGYLIARTLPLEVGTMFTIPLETGILRVGIYDHTDRSSSTIKNLSEVIHIIGGDWTVIEKQSSDTDCTVRGNNEVVVQRISKVLVCKIEKTELEGNFDVEITVGKAFKERF